MKQLHLLKLQRDEIGMCAMFKSDSDLIVVDGGHAWETDNVVETIKSLGGRVSGWYLTHAHIDHIATLCEILENRSSEIEIEKIYYKFPADELLNKYEPGEKAETDRLMPILRNRANELGIETVTPHTGDVYDYDGFSVRILREPDINLTPDYINNSSMIFRIEVDGKRILFLGDLGIEGGEELLANIPKEELKSDYVQMAHHGQDGAEKDVYEVIDPDYCIWYTPTWLWDNIGENGYDTRHFKTVIVRGWMSEIGIKKHYIARDFPQIIEF